MFPRLDLLFRHPPSCPPRLSRYPTNIRPTLPRISPRPGIEALQNRLHSANGSRVHRPMSLPPSMSASSLEEGVRRLVLVDLEAEFKEWSGPVVFSDEPIAGPSTPPRRAPTDDDGVRGQRQFGGTSTSPISVSSSSSPDAPLSRPRGITRYMTEEARTAYTPPRHRTKQWSTGSRTNDAPPKPLHPFFRRDFRRTKSSPAPAPPPSQQPRLIAHYSSTSESASQSSQASSQSRSTKSTQSSRGSRDGWSVTQQSSVHVIRRVQSPSLQSGYASSEVEEEVESPRSRRSTAMDEVAAMMADLQFRPFGQPHRKPLSNRTTLNTKPPAKPASICEPKTQTQASVNTAKPPALPRAAPVVASAERAFFHYRDITPRPKIAYTSNMDEAEDLLSCLQGDVLGFDLEWPTAGKKDVDGRLIGMVRDQQTGRVSWKQGKTALMQFCDEHLVVLVQVWNIARPPNKAIELLQDKSKYKLGVQIRGDGQKLLRDYPSTFPEGIASLLELSYLARKADPVGTGPGNTLISLAKLVKAYTGKDLDKDISVRAGNWTDRLDQSQIDYAANDVVSAVQVFKHLTALARESEVDLDLREFCSDLGVKAPPKAKGNALGSTGSTGSTGPTGSAGSVSESVASRLSPRELQSFSMFKAGKTTQDIALSVGLQIGTVHKHLSQALIALPNDALDLKDQQRFIDEVPKGSYTYNANSQLFGKLRDNLAKAADIAEMKHLVAASDEE